MTVKSDTIHIPDFSALDEDYGPIYAICGKEVRLGDMKHWYGYDEHINCVGCKKNQADALESYGQALIDEHNQLRAWIIEHADIFQGAPS